MEIWGFFLNPTRTLGNATEKHHGQFELADMGKTGERPEEFIVVERQ